MENKNKIKISSYNDLFGLGNSENSMEIDIRQIRSFKNHPFKVIEDEKMAELVQSIKANGVLSPVIVRGNDGDGYEMISGHRRLHASELAGLTKIPAVVRDLSDEEATIVMVDSNIQREELLPSERAFALRMKLEAMKNQGKRTDLDGAEEDETSAQNERKLEAADYVGEDIGMSRAQVRRYIRLTYLIPSLLTLVDQKRLQFTCAVEISYFDENIQKWLNEFIRENVVIKPIQIAVLREHLEKENIDQARMISILNESLPGRKPAKKVVIDDKKLKKYFPDDYSQVQMERVIENLLEQWCKEQKGKENEI